MPTGAYERYGLTGNPFRELASESLADVQIYHVDQECDALLRTIREEVFDQENRAVVAITGPPGSGKTQRLRVTAAEARERKGFAVYVDVPAKGHLALAEIGQAFEKAAKEAGKVRMLGAPAWLRSVVAAVNPKRETIDPNEVGRRIAEALNANVPSFLLLNDLQMVAEAREAVLLAAVLEQVADSIQPGVLIMFTCYASYLSWLLASCPSFVSRVNRTIPLVPLSEEEARLVLAKKLLGKRIVEELEPTYPFDREAIHEVNQAARGNPRRVFEFADAALERAVAVRAFQIDAELARGPAPAATPAPEPAPKEAAQPPAAEAVASAPPPRRSLWKQS